MSAPSAAPTGDVRQLLARFQRRVVELLEVIDGQAVGAEGGQLSSASPGGS